MSKIKLFSAALLAAALPTALLSSGCSGEGQTPESAQPVAEETPAAPDQPSDPDATPGAAAVETPVEPSSVEKSPEIPAPTDGGAVAQMPILPAGHSSDDGHDHSTPALPPGHTADDGHDHGSVVAEAEKITIEQTLPPGHSADDGHDHGKPGQLAQLKVLGNNEGARLTYEVGGEKHTFGRVMQGTVAEHTFQLTSTGTEDLIIKQVKPTCGCTVAQVFTGVDAEDLALYTFGDPIPPGRLVHFPAKLHTKNKTGHQNTRINIFSNDPRGTVQLGLEADIDPFFTINPRFLNFGQISVGDVVTKQARITAAKAQPVLMEVVEQMMPGGAAFELLPVNVADDGRASSWELTVTLGPDLVEGNMARALQLKSDVEIEGADKHHDGTMPTYSAQLTLSAQVVGPFSYSPPYLSMGLVRPGQVVTRTVTLESHDPEFSFANSMPTISVQGLQNPGTTDFREWEHAGLFTPVIRPVDGKNAVDIEVRLEGMPENATGSFRGTLVIEIDHPDKKEIALVITGVCRGGPVNKNR